MTPVEKEKIISLSIAEWHELAMKGTVLPMHIPINGVSMYPLIRRNRDRVSIVPAGEMLTVGDIVLFADPCEKDRYVLHRLWQIEGDRVLTWGDNCDRPDRWMPADCILGKAALIEHGKRTLRPDARKGLALARLWHPVGRCRRRLRALMYKLLYPLWKVIRPYVRKEAGKPQP